MKKHAKLASFGAFGVAAGCMGLLGFMAWGSSPSPTGGIDGVQALIAYIGIAIPLVAIAAAHVVFGRQLARYAKEHGE